MQCCRQVCYYKTVKFKETQQRSLTKSVTFRVLAVIVDLVVIYIITRHVGVTIVLTVITNATSTVLYFLHERLWNHSSWGRQRAK
jgi:uncharacterized membrane protein